MNAARFWQLIAVNLKLCAIEMMASRARTILTSLGIFLGVASLLANLAFIRAMDEDLKYNLDAIGGLNIVTIKSKEPANLQERIEFARSPGLTFPQVREAVKDLEYVKDLLPQADLRWNQFIAGGKNRWGRLTAVGFLHNEAFNYKLSDGRWFSKDEILRQTPVCCIGSRIAEDLFGNPASAINQQVSIRSIPFTVVGVIQSQSVYEQRAMECLIPYGVYTARMESDSKNLGEVAVYLTDNNFIDKAQLDLTRNMKELHRGIEDFTIEINKDKIAEKKAASSGMAVILWCIAAISLIVGGVSIMNIMFATIGDRIREIGIRKALGARGNDIFVQFLLEAILVSIIGGAPGIFFGALVTLFPKGIFPFNPTLRSEDYLLAIGFMLAAGLVSGIFPALKAAKLLPVEALRY